MKSGTLSISGKHKYPHMARRLDQVLVIDVESTCWNRFEIPVGEISEIIEIGLCLVDLASLERSGKRSIMIRPQRSQVSPFCTELTSITQEMVDSAPPLKKGLAILRDEYDCENRVFASWGDYDRNQFHRNCQSFGLKYPFGPTHLNVKTLFSMAFGLPRELDLDEALNHVGLKMEGSHHRGVDDAWNIAKLFALLIKRTRKGVG